MMNIQNNKNAIISNKVESLTNYLVPKFLLTTMIFVYIFIMHRAFIHIE